MDRLILNPLKGIPLIEPYDDISLIIHKALKENNLQIEDGDIFVVAQKIISKSENRYIFLNKDIPSSKALELAHKTKKDPRLIEVILQESSEVVRSRLGVIVVENILGLVHANAGIDRSNIDSLESDPKVLLLPKFPDKSADQLKKSLDNRLNRDVGVIINDSTGRAWRNGTVGIAIGSSGVKMLEDLRGQEDLFGRRLEVTEIGLGDELASAASIIMGQGNEGLPVVIINGMKPIRSDQTAKNLIRDPKQDLFR